MTKNGVPYPISPKEAMLREQVRTTYNKNLKKSKMTQPKFSEKIIVPCLLKSLKLKPQRAINVKKKRFKF